MQVDGHRVFFVLSATRLPGLLKVSLLELPEPGTQAPSSHASFPQLESGLHHAVPGGELRPPCISGSKSLLPDQTPLNSQWGTVRL